MTKHEVTVPGERFAIARDREIRTEFQRMLTQDGSSGIVDSDKHAATMSCRDQLNEITDIKPRIAGCFQPYQCRSIKLFVLCVFRGRSHAHFDAQRSEVSFSQH